eukprot:CAMPEP_0197028602 /NCGR_PEP_ID=MMETSP1384-20130603/8249_1 /TAXON_ID=29189 /ORGANISM="Ammonia sp." /LENGTH=334 /DNA_ID=CAMNT_0042457625 /DNA_START=98 /DNA_END=1102 /DNA_ORIENTATION=+
MSNQANNTDSQTKPDDEVSGEEEKSACTYYKLTPQALGAVVTGIDLETSELSNSLIECIRRDIHRHQLLIFKNQAPQKNFIMSPQKRLQLASKLGKIVSSHYHHPNAVHRDIFRVSNDGKHGCLNVGRTGWHIDGTFLSRPYTYSMMHIVSVPKRGFGQTAFISTSNAIEHVLHKEKQFEALRAVLHRLYFVGTSPNYVVHPVIYTHPVSKLQTMLVHLGMTSTFIEVHEKYKEENIEELLKWHAHKVQHQEERLKVYNETETQRMLLQLAEFIAYCEKQGLCYQHEYEKGDLLISDNLAVIHQAVASTQFKPSQIGLRIMDRISIGDQFRPAK